MTIELTWLTYTALFATCMWLPYILNQIVVRGPIDAVGYPEKPKPLSDWAQRLKCAHYNSVENLVVFGVLVIVAHLADVHTNLTANACVAYFWARVAHSIVYTLGVPLLRTLAFVASWLCSLAMAYSILF